MLLMNTRTNTILTIFAIVTVLGFIVIPTNLTTQVSAIGFGITMCSSPNEVGGTPCIPNR